MASEVKIIVTAVTDAAKAALGQFKGGLSDVAGELTGLNIGALAGAGGVVALGKALGDAVNMAAETQVIQSQLAAVLKSTGGASGMTADSINSMAEEMKNLNAIDDDAIVKASNVMLTFTNVGKNVFPEAMQAAVDLSAAMGQDLQSSVVQLGKALNDPITGVSALQRVGVTFTQTQKDMIKGFVDMGDAASAQKIVLDELNREFGGSGAAAADTYTGKVKALQISMEDLQKAIGTDLLPAATQIVTTFKEGIQTFELLVNLTNSVREAQSKHGGELRKSGMAYADYVAAQKAANNEANKYLSIGQILAITLETDHQKSQQYLNSVRIMSEAEYASAQAAADSDRAHMQWGNNTDTVVVPAMQRYMSVSQMVNEVTKANQVGAVGASEAAMQYVNNLNQLEGATNKLQAAQKNWQKGAAGDIAAELERQGITGEKAKDAMRALDVQFGSSLMAQAGYTEDYKKLVTLYKQGGEEALPKFIEGLGKLDTNWSSQSKGVQEVRTEVINLQSSLDLLVSKSYVVGVSIVTGQSGTVGVNGGRGAVSANNSSNSYTDPLGPGHANGADFVVPPGYPNDSYPMRVQSGEHVVVTPAGQASKGGGNTYNFYYSGNASSQDIQQAYEMARITG